MYEDIYTLDCEFNPVTLELTEVAVVRVRDAALQFYTNVADVGEGARLATLHTLTHFIHNKIIVGCDLSGDWKVLRNAFASANIPMPKPRMSINTQDIHQLLHGNYTHVKPSLSKMVLYYHIDVPWHFKSHFAHYDALKIAWIFRKQLGRFKDFSVFTQVLKSFHARVKVVQKQKREQYHALVRCNLNSRSIAITPQASLLK